MTIKEPALTQEGRGEFAPGAASTLDLLRRRYGCNYITVEQLLRDHLPHIASVRHLRTQIRAGSIALPLSRLHESTRAPRIVYLSHLAAFLDSAEQAARQQGVQQ